MYRFKKSDIPPALDISEIMATQNGSESRFGSRFVKYAGTSETFNKSVDQTGNGINDLRSYAGMISEQKKGIDRMFLLSERAILAITALEKESGVKQVENIPVPSDLIRDSYGRRWDIPLWPWDSCRKDSFTSWRKLLTFRRLLNHVTAQSLLWLHRFLRWKS